MVNVQNAEIIIKLIMNNAQIKRSMERGSKIHTGRFIQLASPCVYVIINNHHTGLYKLCMNLNIFNEKTPQCDHYTLLL